MSKFLPYTLLFSVVVVLLGACSESVNDEQKDLESTRTEEKSRYAHLLKQFKPIDVEIVHVFFESDHEKFKGVKLDSTDSKLLPIDTRDMDYVMDYGVYACFRFDLDSNHVGLIVRTPSIYESSSIDLFIWDKQKDHITYGFQLAQSVGDAGVASLKTSWLIQRGKGNYLTLIYDQEFEQDLEDTTGNSDLYWDFYYHLRWKNNVFDTISTDKKLLRFKYRKLLDEFDAKN